MSRVFVNGVEEDVAGQTERPLERIRLKPRTTVTFTRAQKEELDDLVLLAVLA